MWQNNERYFYSCDDALYATVCQQQSCMTGDIFIYHEEILSSIYGNADVISERKSIPKMESKNNLTQSGIEQMAWDK